ncbi:MAG: tetratricopeptide repeat protein [Bacteroidales bacterium]|nr:tetratricopeptide repeat protein [Bacteroidales bacterium]
MRNKRFGLFTIPAAIFVMALFLGSCSSDPKKEAIEKIGRLEQELVGDTLGPVNKEKANKLVDQYVNYADNYTKDSLAPVYLFKAADIAMNTGMPGKSIMYFNRILNQYPDYRKTPHAMFLKAYVYENHMSNLGKAKTLYEQFIEKYPESDFADDAKVSLKYLGKSPEELIKEFEKNREKKEM